MEVTNLLRLSLQKYFYPSIEIVLNCKSSIKWETDNMLKSIAKFWGQSSDII